MLEVSQTTEPLELDKKKGKKYTGIYPGCAYDAREQDLKLYLGFVWNMLVWH